MSRSEKDYTERLIERYKTLDNERRDRPPDPKRQASAARAAATRRAKRLEADRARTAAERRDESERELLRVLRVKPERINDHGILLRTQETIRTLLKNGREKSQLKAISEYRELDFMVSSRNFCLPKAKRLRLELLLEDIDRRIGEVEEAKRQSDLARVRLHRVASRLVSAGQDTMLARELYVALEAVPATPGYVYLRRWSMPDGSAWYKVGITNDASRRESEQNVLPVAAETIACTDVGSMDRARVIEATIHQVLDEQRITDANNRELFHLTDQQASAVKAAIERLT